MDQTRAAALLAALAVAAGCDGEPSPGRVVPEAPPNPAPETPGRGGADRLVLAPAAWARLGYAVPMAERFVPPDPAFEARVRDSFARQKVMRLFGARLTRVEPGLVEISLPYRDDLTQQHGFFHAGVTSAVADSAGGYAAYTLFPAESSVLTVEFKLNLLAPADGGMLVATGRVLRPGRTLTVCDLDVVVVKGGVARACARGLSTLIRVDRPDRPGGVSEDRP